MLHNISIEDMYPLAPTQEGLLFHTLDERHTGAYFVQSSITLEGVLDINLFRQAWTYLVRRHTALRTSFYWEDLDKPLQLVHREANLPFQVLDWSGMAKDEQASQLNLFLNSDREKGFDLRIPPLFRITLIDLGSSRYQLVWSLHHIILDGWSISLLYQELFASYTNLLEKAPLSLPPAIPYRSYVAWLQQQDLDSAAQFWQSLLADITTPTQLAIEQPDLANVAHTIVEYQTTCPADLLPRLQAFSRQAHLTVGTVLHAAWGLVLSAYSGESDVIFGSVSSGRSDTLPGSENIAGMLLTTLPMRISMQPTASLHDWLSDIQDQLVERRRFDYSPLVQVQSWSEIPYGQPLFESILVFENYPLDDFLQGKFDSLRSTNVKFITPTNYPLTIQILFTPDLTFSVSYDESRFTKGSIERSVSQLATACEAIINAAPETHIRDISVLPEIERHQLLHTFNKTETKRPLNWKLGDELQQQTIKNPDAIAVQYGTQTLTYKELTTQANQVTHWLLSHGWPSGTRIGVFAERDIDMLMMLIACLQAGHTYVPLDPVYPNLRLQQILKNSECVLLATTSDLVERLTQLTSELEGYTPELYIWDKPNPDILQQPISPIQVDVSAKEVATIFYTSGSTGVPKGAMVEYVGLFNHLWAKIDVLQMNSDSCVAQTAVHSFDISIWQFLAALLVGGKVVIYPTETVLTPLSLFQKIQDDEITVLETVPTLLEAFLTAYDNSDTQVQLHLNQLIYLISNAETLPVPLSRRWFHTFPNIALLNTYGATECSDDTTHIIMRKALPASTPRIPVGIPISAFQIYILNDVLQPVPIGCPGQIAMAGVGVGQGYLGDPRKTAVTYIPNPFGGEPGNRLYLTGDLGRWREDGQLDFLGRTDGQVKVRGHRIELGEVQSALSRVSGVRHAVAIVRPNKNKQFQLLGYVVGIPTLTENGIRTELNQLLPHYMVPDQLVILDEMPLNPNGKIDRNALPTPSETNKQNSFSTPARTPLESLVAETWAHVLNLEFINRDDNFFELGGHSLVATQIVTRLRQLVNIDFPLRLLFEQPTVASFSNQLALLRQYGSSNKKPDLVAISRDNAPALSFAQQRLWLIDQLVNDKPLYTMPVVIHLTGSFDRQAFAMALNELVARHETLRTHFNLLNGEPIQIIKEAVSQTYDYLDLRHEPLSEREQKATIAIEAFIVNPFDLNHGPLFRSMLIQTQNDEHLLLFVLHHVITDGWSTTVLIQDFMQLYELVHHNHEAALPPLPIQYADYAVWQRSWLQNDELDAQVIYWREQLANAPALLPLPTDRPRPAAQSFIGTTFSSTIPAAITKKLQTLSRNEGVTLFMTLLAGYQTLLAKYSGQEDILVGTPIAGRVQPELENLIGFFVNTLVMRANVTPAITVKELLAQVRETALAAYAHQDVPFEYLVEVLQPERTLSYTPIYQVAFALQNTPTHHLELTDLSIDVREEGDIGVAKFDLMLSVREMPDHSLRLFAEYSTDLFDESTIRRMLNHYQKILRAMAEYPNELVSEINLLSEEEQNLVLNKWNATTKPYQLTPIYQFVYAQAEKSPNAVAIVCGETSITYAELITRVHQITAALRCHGVKRSHLVGIFLERTIDLVPSILAIHAVGAAYVPLDPMYPLERLSVMIEDANLKLMVSDNAVKNHIPDIQTPILDLATVEIVENFDEKMAVFSPTPDDLAYVMYTSGSTGKPKGVAVPHKSLSSFVLWAKDNFPLEICKGTVAATSVCFDISIFEIFLPLVCGGTVILLENALALSSYQNEPPITLLNIVPSAMGELLQQNAIPNTVKVVCLGGEASTQPLVNEIFAKTSALHVYDVYGPTEDTVYSTWGPLHANRQVLIGKPIANTQVYILDKMMNPVPIGVVGDLYLGGDGQAWGYLGKPGLTAVSFVPHPFSQQGQRLYKTGDMARFLSDGSIEYLGRTDHQVKVHGFRVELDEIRTVLLEHPGISQAIITTYRNEHDNTGSRLAAYVVVHNNEPLNATDLRSHLQAHLPNYMIPSTFTQMESLPQTLNGKIDRRALPKPTKDNLLQIPYTPPTTATQEFIANLWSSFLKVDKIGIHDNFFLLGGHSLLATQLLTHIHSQLNVEIPLRFFFEKPNVEALAQYVDDRSEDLHQPSTDEELLDMIESLSDAEVVKLLARQAGD